LVEKRGNYAYFRFFGHKIANILKIEGASLLAYFGVLYTMLLLLRALAPGVRAESRRSFVFLLLALSPMMLRAGLSSLPDVFSLGFFLAVLAIGIQAKGHSEIRAFLCICFVFLIYASKLYLENAGQSWSMFAIENLFRRQFALGNGEIMYFLPNILYILFYPVLYYGFFPLLGLLFILFRHTDLYRPPQRLLLGCLGLHLLLVGMAYRQNPMDLLPDYTLLLALLFPAWDRMYAYGFHFVGKKRMYWALVFFLLVQLLGNAWMWRH